MTTTTTPEIEQLIEQLLEGIANDGYAIIEHFLPPEIIVALGSDAKKLQEIGEMRRAGTGQTGIGHNSAATADDSIRGDFIHWLDETAISPAQQQYLQRMEELRTSLNQSFYLGLFELESHFAIYPPGAVYKKHLDQFQDNSHRQVSCVLYLNQHWQHEDGGQLRLYLDGENPTPYFDTEPIGGTMIAFLSGRFWHEVLPAKRERMSLTGWFRTRP
ncbi:MAG TPA: 2OG-Fe(II) oxygenase [Methylophilaceae bacterium]|nr:2OG-Fe(II) oxygenase [Methylophilaceae bacterium]